MWQSHNRVNRPLFISSVSMSFLVCYSVHSLRESCSSSRFPLRRAIQDDFLSFVVLSLVIAQLFPSLEPAGLSPLHRFAYRNLCAWIHNLGRFSPREQRSLAEEKVFLETWWLSSFFQLFDPDFPPERTNGMIYKRNRYITAPTKVTEKWEWNPESKKKWQCGEDYHSGSRRCKSRSGT